MTAHRLPDPSAQALVDLIESQRITAIIANGDTTAGSIHPRLGHLMRLRLALVFRGSCDRSLGD